MKTRLVLLLILTLIIGFIIGWLASAQVRLHKLQSVRMYLSNDHFREGFYKIIQPDDKQKAEIDKVLDKWEKMNSEFQLNIRKDMDSSMKAFRKELDSKLTKEQIARMKESDEKRQEMIRRNMRNRPDSTRDWRSRQGGYDRDFERNPHPGERQGPPPSHHPSDSVR